MLIKVKAYRSSCLDLRTLGQVACDSAQAEQHEENKQKDTASLQRSVLRYEDSI